MNSHLLGSGTSPDMEYWGKVDSVTLQEAALILHGIDPRAIGEVVDRDGCVVDGNEEFFLLQRAVLAGELKTIGDATTAPDKSTMVSKREFVQWGCQKGYDKAISLFEAGKEQAFIPNLQPYLDQTHENYSTELADAIQAWMDLFHKGGATKLPIKQQVRGWAVGRTKSLTGSCIERIATLINPDGVKKGGRKS